MTTTSKQSMLISLTVGAVLAVLIVGVGLSLNHGVDVTASNGGGTGGTGNAQSVPIILIQPMGVFPTQSAAVVNLSVDAVDTGLIAGDIEFIAYGPSGAYVSTSFSVVLVSQSGTTLASFNSSLSTWSGEGGNASANPYGGWTSGVNSTVALGDTLTFAVSGPVNGFDVMVWVAGGGGDGHIQTYP